jgi:hypothetical protein
VTLGLVVSLPPQFSEIDFVRSISNQKLSECAPFTQLSESLY